MAEMDLTTEDCVFLNRNELSTLCRCLMTAPGHSAIERQNHVKLHAKLLHFQHQLELNGEDNKCKISGVLITINYERKEQNNG